MARHVMSRSAPSAGMQGTLGGPAAAVGPRPGKRLTILGDEVYLWILVIAEVAIMMFLRSAFSRYHGG